MKDYLNLSNNLICIFLIILDLNFVKILKELY